MHKRTKACAITPETKREVEKRDNGVCIFCGRPGRGEAHFVPRSHGGLGIPANLLTVCRPCHDLMDNSQARPLMLKRAEAHLRECYPGWDKSKLIYSKW